MSTLRCRGVSCPLAALGIMCLLMPVGCAATGQETQSPKATADAQTATWLDCDDREHREALLALVREHVASPPSLVAQDDLRACLDAVLRSFCGKSSKPFRDGLLVAPRTLHAEPFVEFLRTEVRPAVLPESTAELSPREAFFYLLDHPGHRNMTPVRVARSSITAGRGLALEQREEWNSTSVFAQKSMVQTPKGGFLTSDQVEGLDHGSQSFWLDMVVEFAEGYRSRVRIIFYYNTEHERWFPTAMIVEDPMMSLKDDPAIMLRPWPMI